MPLLLSKLHAPVPGNAAMPVRWTGKPMLLPGGAKRKAQQMRYPMHLNHNSELPTPQLFVISIFVVLFSILPSLTTIPISILPNWYFDSLLCKGPAELRRLDDPWKLLRTENLEWFGKN
jgi:hypothetical protein